MKLVFSASAVQQMDHIAASIARDKPRAAERWLDKLRQFLKGLSRFPSRGKLLDLDEDGELRQVVFGNYLIVYETTGRKVLVHSIQHGAMIPAPGKLVRGKSEEE